MKKSKVHPYYVKSKKPFTNLSTLKDLHTAQPRSFNVVAPYFSPLQVAAVYSAIPGDGTGQKIGVIELGGGYNMSDLTTYLNLLGITGPPNVTAVGVDGGINNPSDLDSSVEVVLDVEIIMAIAPKAAIRVYFAPNSDQGFYDAINQAYLDGCKIISISWGAAEQYWNLSVMNTYNNLFNTLSQNGVTVFAAAGDQGSSDGAPGTNVDFPGSSPFVVSCGGTTLSASGTTRLSEVVWNNNPNTSATGGGVSSIFAKPSYQNGISSLSNYRGVPDVSGNADPNTGYVIYINGNQMVVGGTSAVSPLWAGLSARLNQMASGKTGFLQPQIYPNPSVCFDVTSGNNGAYSASSGWDKCTGIGSPNTTSLFNLLNNGGSGGSGGSSIPVVAFTATTLIGSLPLTVTFTDESTNAPTSWIWYFGDGSIETTKNPIHIYTKAGTYDVRLVATNSSGSGSLTKSSYITVTRAVVTANFTAAPASGRRPLTVTFNNTSTGNPNSFLWSFGDGITSSARSPFHQYTRPGKYTVTLKASGSNGSNTVTKKNVITVQ